MPFESADTVSSHDGTINSLFKQIESPSFDANPEFNFFSYPVAQTYNKCIGDLIVRDGQKYKKVYITSP